MGPRLAPALRELNRLLAAAAVDLNAQLRFALLGGLAVSGGVDLGRYAGDPRYRLSSR